MPPSASAAQVYAALIGMKSYSNEGVALGRQVVGELQAVLHIDGVSSIYKVKRSERHPFHIHDLKKIMDFEGLSVVFKVTTELPPLALMQFLQEKEKKHGSVQLHRSLSLNLLAFENQTQMTKALTLPHPELHLKPELLFPSAELWPQYEHPVKKQTLQELTRVFANLRWGEFFEQGKTLLDF
jgi:7,8-dihydro-6-hydroxymethylpterin-pyrophosphokinase